MNKDIADLWTLPTCMVKRRKGETTAFLIHNTWYYIAYHHKKYPTTVELRKCPCFWILMQHGTYDNHTHTVGRWRQQFVEKDATNGDV